MSFSITLLLWAPATLSDTWTAAIWWGLLPWVWRALDQNRGYLAGFLASLPFFEDSGFWVIPVVDEQMKYQGYLPWQSVAKTLFYTGFNAQNGGIIRIVFHTQRDSMSVIAKIIEENKGLITRSYLTKSTKVDHVWPELILQIQTDQFSAIVKSLERHEVHIEKAFMFGDQEEVDQSRFELLLKYLNP
jgi:hypothetical protein